MPSACRSSGGRETPGGGARGGSSLGSAQETLRNLARGATYENTLETRDRAQQVLDALPIGATFNGGEGGGTYTKVSTGEYSGLSEFFDHDLGTIFHSKSIATNIAKTNTFIHRNADKLTVYMYGSSADNDHLTPAQLEKLNSLLGRK